MSWDPKAERIAAKGQAAKDEAAAAAIWAQSVREDRSARWQEEAERRAERERRRQKRKDERAKQRAAVLASIRTYAVPVGAIGSPEVIAWSGQYSFAVKTMKLGVLAPLLPVALEGGTLYTAKLALEAIDAGKPAGKYRFATWVQAGIAAGMNYWHGSAGKAGAQVGVAFALTSLLGIVMLELTVALKKHKASGRSAADIRTALVRRLRYPVLSLQASAIGAARGLEAEEAWRAAWVDRYGIGPDSTRRERRTARTVLARQQRIDCKAARKGGLVILDGAIAPRSAELAGERSQDAPVSPRVAFVDGGVAELEQMLRKVASAPGATLDSLGGPRERSHRERMSAHDGAHGDEPMSGDERSDQAPGERSSSAHGDGESSGKGERSKRRRGRKTSARDDRLEQVRRLLDERSTMSGADIAAELNIPESTARRLRARVLRERGEQ